jgi:uncharacterized protein YqeY
MKETFMMDRISTDITAAMKAKDKPKLQVLRYVKKLLLENKTSLKPQPELDIVISYAKKLRDSAGAFPEGHEQSVQMLAEVDLLAEYLPQPLTEDEVMALIQEIKDQGAAQMGQIMKELTPQTKGRFDGKRASELVREALKS